MPNQRHEPSFLFNEIDGIKVSFNIGEKPWTICSDEEKKMLTDKLLHTFSKIGDMYLKDGHNGQINKAAQFIVKDPYGYIEQKIQDEFTKRSREIKMGMRWEFAFFSIVIAIGASLLTSFFLGAISS